MLDVVRRVAPRPRRGQGPRRSSLDLGPLDDETLVLADEEAVRQIVDNLIDNAIKYTPEGGSVRVSCRLDGDAVAIEVADTGIGIPRDDLPRVFERFYRVDKARSRELGGTGLGLSIVKHLVQSIGGQINVDSRVGAGSQFTVQLPRVPAASSASQTAKTWPGCRTASRRPPIASISRLAFTQSSRNDRLHWIFSERLVESGSNFRTAITASGPWQARPKQSSSDARRVGDAHPDPGNIGLTAGSLLGIAAVVPARHRRWPAAAADDGGRVLRAPRTIVVDGSSTVFRISSAAQEAYSKVNPDVDGRRRQPRHRRRLQPLPQGRGRHRRRLAPRQARRGGRRPRRKGIDWTRFLVGYDGITLVVNPKNDFVKSLTVEQLKTIWEPESKVKTWKDVDPSWPDRKIVLYSPDNDSGTFEFFTEAIVGKAKSQREDVQASSDDNILVNGVAGDADGLGYFGYAYYAANKDKLRAVAVQNGPDAKPVAAEPRDDPRQDATPRSRDRSTST